MKKNYHISTYGSWYTRIENIDEQTQKGIEIYSKDYFKDIIKYGYVDFQGKYDNYQIGHIEKDIYSLCRVKIIKGRKIQNDQEILINQKVSKNYKLYDQIEIEGKNYTIVGIIQTANKNLPDIYTNLETYQTKDYYSNMSVLSNNHYIQFNDGNNYQEIETNQLQQTFEFIIITLFVLFALTSTSLKKRMKEMALYRGIGMTTNQLMMMVMQENMLISFFSILIGLLIGVCVSLGYLYLQSKTYHTFIYQISFKEILFLVLVLMSCIFITILIPVYSSSKNALIGIFDSKKFNYIQVRYKKSLFLRILLFFKISI